MRSNVRVYQSYFCHTGLLLLGEMLGNARGLSQNCLINNQMKMNDKIYSKKEKQFPNERKQLQIQIQVTQNCILFQHYFVPLHRNMACNLVCNFHAEVSIVH